jgi:hypothetical protein
VAERNVRLQAIFILRGAASAARTTPVHFRGKEVIGVNPLNVGIDIGATHHVGQTMDLRGELVTRAKLTNDLPRSSVDSRASTRPSTRPTQAVPA